MDTQLKSKLGWTLALLVILGLLVIAVTWIVPDMMAGVSAALDPGVSMKSAAKYAFVLTWWCSVFSPWSRGRPAG